MIYLFYLELCNKEAPAQGSVIPATPLMEQCDPSHISPILSAGIQPRRHLPGYLPTLGWAGSSPRALSRPDTFCSRAGRCSGVGYSCPRAVPPLEGLLAATSPCPSSRARAGLCSCTQQRAQGWSRFQIQPPDFRGVGCRTANPLLTLQSRVLQSVLNHGHGRVGSDWGYSCAEHVGRCFCRLLPQYSPWSYTEFGG